MIPRTVKARLENGLLLDQNMRRQIISTNCLNLWNNISEPSKKLKKKLALTLCEQFEDLKQLEGPPEVNVVQCLAFSSPARIQIQMSIELIICMVMKRQFLTRTANEQAR